MILLTVEGFIEVTQTLGLTKKERVKRLFDGIANGYILPITGLCYAYHQVLVASSTIEEIRASLIKIDLNAVLASEVQLKKQLSMECIRQIGALAAYWSGYSGRPSYPIAFNNKEPDAAYEEAAESGRLYKGDYGALRKDLAAFLVTQIEERFDEDMELMF